METTTIDRLIKGVGVIIDDDAETPEKPAADMLLSIKDAGIPMVVYTDIPDISVIESLGNISFIILDWDFTGSKLMRQLPAGVDLGSELRTDEKRTILEFLQELLNKIFAPVFLITGQNFEDVKSELNEADLYHEEKANRILLKSKEDVHSYDTLIQSVGKWLESTPSAHALKLWEREAVVAKNEMFLELYNASPAWVNVLIDVLKEDTNNNEKAVNHDFNMLLNNILLNRMHDGNFCAIEKTDDKLPSTNEIRKVLQGERYIVYDPSHLPDVSYVGDLYKAKMGTEFYINIRAQCNLIREEDPVLYLIPGEELNSSNITKSPRIKMKFDNKNRHILSIDKREYCLEEMVEYNKAQKGNFNAEMNRNNKLLLYDKGEIIDKKHSAVLSCIADILFIEFHFKEFMVEKKTTFEEKAARIGRVIPPYITKLQNEFSSYIVREGIMHLPEEIII